ncbi:MAG: potassium channel protein [Betaproteobacteria bacterium]|nr:potassium channel protein [Betaproteobacteria bacterium]
MLAIILVIGTVGYRLIGGERYSLLDSFYMTFITIATIGFSEIVDLSEHPGGRVFTVFIGFAGIAAMTYLTSIVTAFLIEGRINEAIGRRRMEKHIHRLKDHYIICGIGRVGRNVAHELTTTHHTYVVIDEDMHSIDTHLEKFPGHMYIHGDASDDDVLQKAHIETARGVFAVTGDDSKNLMISLTAKQLNPATRVVARCHEIRNTEKLRKTGADAIVSPDFTGGLRIASAMIRPHVVTFLDQMLKSDENLRVEEVIVPAGFSEQPIDQLNLPSRNHILLALHEGEQWVFNPPSMHMLRAGMTLVIMATPEGRRAVEEALGWV